MQPISNLLLEMFVLSKPYFDRQGLIVAEEQGQVLGFSHGGFGPNAAGNDLATDVGLICMLLVRQHPQRIDIAQELLHRSEDYLRQRGDAGVSSGWHVPLQPVLSGVMRR